MTKPLSTTQISRHFGVAKARINQDLASGFLIDCVPSRQGKPRQWDEAAFIAAYFYFQLSDEGMSRFMASKTAMAIAVFSKRNPSESLCAILSRNDRSEVVAENCGQIPRPDAWPAQMQKATIYNIAAAKLSYQSIAG